MQPFAFRAGLAVVVVLVAVCGCGGGDSTRDQTEQDRIAADLAAAKQLNLTLRSAPHAPFAGPPPEVVDALAPSLAERSCVVISPAPGGHPRELKLPPGGAVVEAAEDAPATVLLRREARHSFPIDLGRVAAGDRGVVDIPLGDGGPAWQMAIRSTAMLSVCGRGTKS